MAKETIANEILETVEGHTRRLKRIEEALEELLEGGDGDAEGGMPPWVMQAMAHPAAQKVLGLLSEVPAEKIKKLLAKLGDD